MQLEEGVRDSCLCHAGYSGATCTQCQIGKFKHQDGPSPCYECPVGFNADPWSRTSCRCNDAGSVFSGDNGGVCSECVLGTFLASPNFSACSDCP